MLEMQNRYKEMIREYKRRPCMDCGVQYPFWVMHFDHRPDEDKRFNMNKAHQNYGKARILAEIAKCDVVCANCHATRTYLRSQPMRFLEEH